MGDDENKNYINGLYGVDRDKQDAFPDTVWSKEPHKGTVWQNENQSQADPIDKKEQDKRSWTERSKNSNGESRGKGGRFLLSMFFAVIFINIVIYGHAAIAETINNQLVGQSWDSTRGFLQQWLGLGTRVFLHISTLIIIIASFMAQGRNFLGYITKGAMFVIMTGLLAFFGTFLYLAVTEVFLVK